MIIWTRHQSTSGLKEKQCNEECWQNEEMSEQKKIHKNPTNNEKFLKPNSQGFLFDGF